MADEAPPKITHPATPIIVLFFVAAIVGGIMMRFNDYIANHPDLANFLHVLNLFLHGQASFTDVIAASGSPALVGFFLALKFLAVVLSVLFVIAIYFAYRKSAEASRKLRQVLEPPKKIHYGVKVPEHYVNPKWAKVIEHINSPNPSDWRLAILEADIMLNDMLDKMGYHGATMSEKLKGVERLDFKSLDDAWEAHKVRNAIAHEGSDLVMNKPEAERVVRLFEKVFKEFKYV